MVLFPALRARAPLVATLVVTTALLVPSLRGAFLWDDVFLIVHNDNIQDLSRLPRALASGFWSLSDQWVFSGVRYYRPFITLLYALAWQLFGSAPLGYHALSLLAHLGCVGLAAQWLARRAGDVGRAKLPLFFALALFALHPSRVESVVWISGCTDVWMTLWLLAAHALWSRGARVSACLVFALATFSKEAAFAFPLLMAADTVLGVGDSDDGHTLRSRLRALVPLFATATLCFAVRVLALRGVGLEGSIGSLAGVLERVSSTLGGYLARTVVPWPPRAVFRVDVHGRLASLWGVLGLTALAGVGTLGGLAWRRRGLRPWLADVLWVLVPLAPVLNAVPLFDYTLLAQRFLYLPMLGVSALVLRALGAVSHRVLRPAVFALVGGITCLHAVALPLTATSWRDDLTLWTHERTVDPSDPYPCRQLATHLATRDRPRAVALFAHCHRLARSQGRDHHAQASALGALAARLDLLPDAARSELLALRALYESLRAGRPSTFSLDGVTLTLDPRTPGWAAATRDPMAFAIPAAMARFRTGDLAGAEGDLRALVARHPSMGAALGNLALVLGRSGRFAEALEYALRARAARPGDGYVQRLVDTLTVGEGLERIPDPREQAFQRARVMLDLHAPQEALDALRVLGDDAPAPVVLLRVRALVAQGRVGDAIALVEAARRRAPAHAIAWEGVLAQLRALRP